MYTSIHIYICWKSSVRLDTLHVPLFIFYDSTILAEKVCFKQLRDDHFEMLVVL